MGINSRATRYVFKPAVARLERRDVPSALGVPPDLRNLSATITGSTEPGTESHAGSGSPELAFAGAGKDTAGHSIKLSGSIATSSATQPPQTPSSTGSATLTTRRGTYRFDMHGPVSDLASPSGVTNMTFTIQRQGPHANLLDIANGAVQIHREPGPVGGEFTASMVITGVSNRQFFASHHDAVRATLRGGFM